MAKTAAAVSPIQPKLPLRERLRTLPQRARLALRKYWFIYLLALPGIIFLLLFSYGPMYGILLAFKDFKINKGVWGSPWVGLLHYKELFSDPSFIQAFKNTVIINVYHLIFGFSFNVFLALMINELQFRRIKSVIQTCVYLPYFLSWVIFAGLVQVFLQAPVPGDVGGVVNQIIVALGGEAVDFMKRPELFRGILVVTNIIKTAGYSGEEMFAELISIAGGFKDNELNSIVSAILQDNRMELLYWPAAFKLHHAVRGGLLLHTLSMVRLAQAVCKIYTFVDEELLISGAILHDIAKLKEFDVADSGIATGYTVSGNLLGHLAMGAAVIDKYAEKLGISRQTAVLLEHMCLSHHGEPEFGAAVRPMFIEAELLSEIDLMDSRIYEMKEALAAVPPEDFSSRIWAMDNRRIFNHGRKELGEEIKLF